MSRSFFFASAAACLGLLAGCGSRDPGSHVAGMVTYDGAPVPAGRIYFEPDFTEKNTGPQGASVIRDGRYDTRKGGRGAPHGAVIVRVEGFDGKAQSNRPMGQATFVYEAKANLPAKGDTGRDFLISAADAQKVPEDTEPGP